ncbi:MAG: ABC transporter substrate-binding protein [Oscillospiraceae bacterium]
MKKLLALVLALVMVFALAACGGTNNENEGNNQEENEGNKVNTSELDNNGPTESATFDQPTKITVGLANSYSTLDPFVGSGLYTNFVAYEVYQRLGARDNYEQNTITPILMKDYEYVGESDGLYTYHITIHEGIYDSEGNDITAEDVAFCFNYVKENARTQHRYIDHAEATSETELDLVITSNELGTFGAVIENVGIVSQAALEASSDAMATQDQVGSGPYVITDFVAGSYITLEKNENYWAADRDDLSESPMLDQTWDVIEFDFLTEPNQMQSALETGTIQLGLWLDATINAGCKTISGYKVMDLESPQMCVILYNQYEGPCTDENFRKAVSYAINEGLAVDNILYGVGEPAEYFGIFGSIGTNEEWADQYDNYAYDLDKAKEYLEASSYSGEDVIIAIRSNTLFRNCGQLIQSNLEAIGITCHIDEYDAATISGKQVATTGDHGYDITFYYMSRQGSYLIQTASTWLSNVKFADGHSLCGIADDELQSLIDACYSEDWTQDDYDALEAYIQEHCLIYQWYNNYFSLACVDNMTITGYNRSGVNGDIIVGSLAVPSDWEYFA